MPKIANLHQTSPRPERIKEARLSRGLTQEALAEKIGVSRQAICQFENGTNAPKPEKVILLENELQFPSSYFYKPIEYRINTPIFFRSFKTAEKRDREMFKVRVYWMLEIFYYLSRFINFTDITLLKKTCEEYMPEEIENIANELRRYWGLGLGPISNVLLLLENNGVIISKMSLGKRKVDACSILETFKEAGRPIMFLSKDKSSASRSRFDAAHELGHMVLHSWINEEHLHDSNILKRVEDEANYFAGAFLMPAESFSREVYSLSTLDSFVMLKQRWKVSVAAMVRRCFNLGIIDQQQYANLNRKIGINRWRTEEPLDDILPDEKPEALKRAIQLLINEKVQSPLEILDSIALPREEIDMLCGLDEDTLNYEKRRISLKIVK